MHYPIHTLNGQQRPLGFFFQVRHQQIGEGIKEAAAQKHLQEQLIHLQAHLNPPSNQKGTWEPGFLMHKAGGRPFPKSGLETQGEICPSRVSDDLQALQRHRFFFLRQGLPVVQVSLELKILLFLPPKSWDYRCVPQCLVNSIEFLNFYCYYFFGSGD
jgi:hypothetical protein